MEYVIEITTSIIRRVGPVIEKPFEEWMTHCGHVKVLYNNSVLVAEYIGMYGGFKGYYQYVLFLHHSTCHGQKSLTYTRKWSDSSLQVGGLLCRNDRIANQVGSYRSAA